MEFSAGGIVYRKPAKNQFEFALILDGYDQWTFPKGKIEKGEKPEHAASREICEELGIEKVEIVKLIDKIDYWFKEKEILIHKFVYFYVIRASLEAQLHPQLAEVKEAKWLNPSEARNILGYKKENAVLLQKAIKILEKIEDQ